MHRCVSKPETPKLSPFSLFLSVQQRTSSFVSFRHFSGPRPNCLTVCRIEGIEPSTPPKKRTLYALNEGRSTLTLPTSSSPKRKQQCRGLTQTCFGSFRSECANGSLEDSSCFFRHAHTQTRGSLPTGLNQTAQAKSLGREEKPPAITMGPYLRLQWKEPRLPCRSNTSKTETP